MPQSSSEYKRSASVTVVEGRRSTDVWLDKGEAVADRTRLGRAIGMLAPAPKLSVMPPEANGDDKPLTPPLPIQDPDALRALPATPNSRYSAEMGMQSHNQTKDFSYLTAGENLASFQTEIMVAERHYSAVATTLLIPPPREKRASTAKVATGVATTPIRRSSNHLRSRSATSVSSPRFPVSPPPPSPLPPTPPSKVNLAGAADLSDYSFGPVGNDDINEIDALSAGLLPLLVPGLKVGSDMKVKDVDWTSSPGTWSMSKAGSKGELNDNFEFGLTSGTEWSPPQFHSTPVNRKGAGPGGQRSRKSSHHKKGHFSLPRFVDYCFPSCHLIV